MKGEVIGVSDKKKNILIVHNYYQIPGGEDTVVANEKKMLENHGHKVILYTRNNAELKQMSKLRKLLLPFTTVFNPRTYKEVRKLLKEENIEVVHVHNTLNLISPAVYYGARSMKVPVVQTIHNFRLLCPGATFYRDGHICEDCVQHGLKCAVKHGCYRGSRVQTLICVISICLHRLTGIYGKINYICLTEFNKNKLLQLKQIKPEQVFVKPNFTYVPNVQNETGEFYLFIGRIEEIKGVPLILEAFEKMPDKRLVVAGTGTKLEEYKMKEKEFKNIEFKGFVAKEKLQFLLEKTKAVVVASQWYETFGMIVAESFASHVPVIVGDIGNVGSLVDDGINGVKFQYDSPSALIQAIERFEQMDRKVLGENAFQKYKKCYGPNENCKIMNNIYINVASSVRGGECCTCENKDNLIPEGKRENQFIFVGRLDKLKGINILFEAWKKMGDTAPRLSVCGTGPMENWCKSFIHQNQVNIELCGFIHNEEIRKMIANSKALILATQWYEGFPMSIVEAFSVGTPVVCSDLGNAGSVVDEGITGYKFECKSIDSIISAVGKIKEKPLNREKIKKLYEMKYSENTNYKILNGIYASIGD